MSKWTECRMPKTYRSTFSPFGGLNVEFRTYFSISFIGLGYGIMFTVLFVHAAEYNVAYLSPR